jgi:hypothetical protein
MQGGAPKLFIGKNKLEGEEVKLKKPVAVMTLRKDFSGAREYHAIGIVRSKLVFKNRPIPASRPASVAQAAPGRKRTRADEPAPIAT